MRESLSSTNLKGATKVMCATRVWTPLWRPIGAAQPCDLVSRRQSACDETRKMVNYA